MQFCRMLKWESLHGVRMRHMVALKRQVGNIEAQNRMMRVYEARHDAKLRTEKSVLSVEGVKRE